MKQRLSTVATLAAVVWLIPVIAFGEHMVQTYSKSTNIRSASNSKASIVTKLPAGSKLRITARNNETDLKKVWLKVETDNGKMGWVSASVVKYVKPSSAVAPMDMGSSDMGGGSAAPAAPMDTEAPSDSAAPAAQDAAPAPVGNDIPDIEILDSVDDTSGQ